MRRLQANLTYMFALADPKGKAQIPPSPAFLTPPPLNLQLKLRLPPSTPDDPIERPADPVADRAERDQLLKNLYKKLQSLFPGIDFRKEPLLQRAPGTVNPNAAAVKGPNGQAAAAAGANAAAGPGAGAGASAGVAVSTPVGGQGSNHNSPAPAPPAQNTPRMANAAAPPVMQQG